MKPAVVVAAVAGLAVATGVVAWIGFGAVLTALNTVGWRGFAVLVAYSAAPLCLLGTAWFLLDAEVPARRWGAFVWARIVRDAAGELLPFSPVGGFVAGARAAILRGIAPTLAYATSVVDVTTELIAQLGFTGLGLALLALRLGARSAHNALVEAALAGLALTAAGAVAFIALQRRGGGFAERWAARFIPGAAEQTARIGRALIRLYENPWRVAAAVALHMAAWIASALGVWLALRLAGVAIGVDEVLAIESIVAAVRSAAVVAPMGIGVQEAAYALIGPLFGLGPDLALAVSLIKRARDLAIGVPALLAWQGLEGLRAVGRRGGRDRALGGG